MATAACSAGSLSIHRVEAAVEVYVDLLIDSMRYQPAWLDYQKDGDPDKFLQAICAEGYATAPTFKVG